MGLGLGFRLGFGLGLRLGLGLGLWLGLGPIPQLLSFLSHPAFLVEESAQVVLQL